MTSSQYTMDIIDRLERTKADTLRAFETPPELLDRSPGEGKWSVRQILHHLTDAELVLLERIRRALSEERPQVFAFAQELWARAMAYERQPLEPSKHLYAALRTALIALAKEQYDSGGGRTFTHSEMGVRTVTEEFDKAAEHNEQHLRQIASVLERVSGR